ncbi:MAG: OmpA family protein [Methylococcales bacterium]
MFKKHLITLAALTSLGLFSSVYADDSAVDKRWYVAPYGNFIQPGGDRNSEVGWGGGMSVGKIFNEHFNVELKGFYQGYDGANKNGRWDITGGSAEIQYYLSRGTFSPYSVIGLGGINSNHNEYNGVGFIGEAGAGATYEINDNFLVRSDVRYRYNNNLGANLQQGTNEFNDVVVNMGFVVPFGSKPKHVVAQSPAPTPAPTPVVQAHTTDCSALDTDHDGVNDCADQCPKTPAGAHVAINGCWTVDVKFDNDKAIIKPQYFKNLDNAALIIRNNPDLNIEVQGHTSKTGALKHNITLSENRALAVKKYLVHDTHSPHMTTQGYGWTRPIDTNDTEEGRSNNRRVQLEIDGNRSK